MSNLFKSSKKETQETQIDPRVYQEVLQNLQLARQISQIPFEPYQGMMIAPFTQDYMTGEAMTRDIARQGGFVPEVEAAARSAAGLMGFQPTPVLAGQVRPGTVFERAGAQQLPTTFGAREVGAQQLGTAFAPQQVAAQQIGTTFAPREVGAALAAGPERVAAGQVGAQFAPERIAARDVGGALAGGFERITPQAISTQFNIPSIAAERVRTDFTARDVAAPGEAPTIEAARFLGADLGQYMNPYTQGVIDVGLSDIGRAEELARQQRGARATAARAFGGSRAAVQEGIAAGEAARERNRFIAEQRAQAFREAAGLREADVGREQQASLANQAAAQQVMQLAQQGQISNQERDLRLAQLGLTADQANQAAALQAAQANQAAAQQAEQMRFAAEQFNAQQAMQAAVQNQAAAQQYMQMGLTAEQANQQAALDAAARNQAAGLQAGELGLTAEQANQQAALQANLANQQAVQRYMESGLTAEQANQQAALDAQRLGVTAGQANQQAALQAALANQQATQQAQQMGLTAGQANQEAALRAALANQAAAQQGQQMGLTAGQANQEAALRAALANQQAGLQAQQMGLTAGQSNQEAMLRAMLANQQAGLQAQGMTQGQQQFNVEQQMRAALANQQAGLSGAQFQLQAGRQLGDLGQQALQNRYGAASAMMGLGGAQQNLMQQYLNAQQQEFMRRINYPMQQLAISQGAVSASPYNVTQYGTQQGRQSLWDVVGNVFSDERMKYNIKPIRNPLDKVKRMEGVTFNWKDDDVEDGSIIAQDVEKVMPEAVSMDEESGMRKVSMPQMVGVLTEAVKELDAKVEGKKKRGKRNG